MRFEELRKKLLKYPIFKDNDILKWFPKEKPSSIQVQLSRLVKEGKIKRLKKGIYYLAEKEIKDRFFLAPILYKPSYISLETALNLHGLIPDIPAAVTRVTTNKTCQFKTEKGVFIYHKIKKEFFWGFTKVLKTPFFYFIARPEKAVLDYLYFKSRGVYPKSLLELRFQIDKNFSWKAFENQAKNFGKINEKLIKDFVKRYKK